MRYLDISMIDYSDITSWAEKNNKVRFEWEVVNPEEYDFNNLNPIVNLRIRETQLLFRHPAFIWIFSESGLIKTEQKWYKIPIEIKKQGYKGSILIDVELLKLEKMAMMTGFFVVDKNVLGYWGLDYSTHNIYFDI